MKILVINNAEPGDRAFNEPLLASLSGLAKVEFVNYRQIPPADTLATQYDGVVLSGVPVHYDFDTIHSRLAHLSWIKTIPIPVLGICLGHQNIGRMYGSRVIMHEEAEDGMHSLQIVRPDPLLKGINHGDKVAARHRGSVTLPGNFVLLASTPNCSNQAMKHVKMDIYGIQFHAELSDAGGKILSNFVDIVRSKKYPDGTTLDATKN